MWEYELSAILRIYLPASILAMICVVSILQFLRAKKKGHLVVSIGFALLAIGWVILLVLTYYIQFQIMLTYSGYQWLFLSYALFYIIPALLILMGFIFMYKETKRTDRFLSG